MPTRATMTRLAACLSLIVAGSPLFSRQTARPKAQKASASLQSQIDELKEGQQQMLKELAEIKALLKAGAARVDTPAAQKPPSIPSISVYGEPFKGDAKARVAIMEYSDFDCSFCARYATQIYPQIDAAYVKTGKIKYFFRDLPGPEHPNAPFKAQVARCAGEQGKFWEMHDRLFADQKPLDTHDLSLLIESLGLDAAQFSEALSSGKYAEPIRRSAASAARMQINGTPAFLIGTLSEDGSLLKVVKVSLGADTFEGFKATLDELLEPQKAQP